MYIRLLKAEPKAKDEGKKGEELPNKINEDTTTLTFRSDCSRAGIDEITGAEGKNSKTTENTTVNVFLTLLFIY